LTAKTKTPRATKNELSEYQQARVIPPLVVSPSASRRCCELVESVIDNIDHGLEFGQTSTVTDRQLEVHINVCAAALSWLLAALSHPSKRDRLLEELMGEAAVVVYLVKAARMAVKYGFNTSDTLNEALKSITEVVDLATLDETLKLMAEGVDHNTPTKNGHQNQVPVEDLRRTHKSVRQQRWIRQRARKATLISTAESPGGSPRW
jgi:hypothetical protein